MLRTAALELFHMFALIHDDVIDGSDLRRGRPTVHRSLAWRREPGELFGGRSAAFDEERVGESTAILVGDLVLVWSDELLHGSGLDPELLRAVRPLLDATRTELMLGQYLDLLATRDPTADVETALTVVRYKNAKYTIERSGDLPPAPVPVLASALVPGHGHRIPVHLPWSGRTSTAEAVKGMYVSGVSDLGHVRSTC